jgi:hypothetical protein
LAGFIKELPTLGWRPLQRLREQLTDVSFPFQGYGMPFSLYAPLVGSSLHRNAPHGFRGGAKEVRPIPLPAPVARQPQPPHMFKPAAHWAGLVAIGQSYQTYSAGGPASGTAR